MLFLNLFLVPSVSAVSKTLVINSFKVAGTKSTDEYVEIANISNGKINIGGWQLAKQTASGSKYNLITSFQSLEILPGDSILVGPDGSSEPHDLAYTTGYSLAENNTIVLYSDSGKTIVDKVGYGKATIFEGTVMPEAGTETWIRVDGIDTDNNQRDFQKESTVGPARDYSGICLTEIMPDPGSGKEEWIEIYNSEVTRDISGLTIADKLGSTKKFTVPAGTVIEEGKYLIFSGDKTGLALNNDGDGVVLLDSDGSILDDTGESYGKTKSGQSYAYDGEKWFWSSTPTPGAENIITLESEGAAKKKTKKTTAKKPKAKKGKAPKVSVLGDTDEGSDIFGSGNEALSDGDRLLGYILIGVALLLALSYTIYVNKDKLRAAYKRERKRYKASWKDLRGKMQRGRNISSFGRAWWRKDPIHERNRRWPWYKK